MNPAYLKDDTGNAVFPKHWQTKCLGPPVLYTIKEKQKKYVEVDAHEDLNYDGNSMLCLLDVPLDVEEILLEKLIRFALEDEDPIYRDAVGSISDTEKKMKEIEQKSDEERTAEEDKLREIQINCQCIIIQLCYRAQNINKLESLHAIEYIKSFEHMVFARKSLEECYIQTVL